MTRDELNAAHSAAIRRHWRGLDDDGGQPGAALLGELAAVAEQHAADVAAEASGITATTAGPEPESARPAPRRRPRT